MFQKLKVAGPVASLLICDACYTGGLFCSGRDGDMVHRTVRKLRQARRSAIGAFMHYERGYQDTFLQSRKISLAQDPACSVCAGGYGSQKYMGRMTANRKTKIRFGE